MGKAERHRRTRTTDSSRPSGFVRHNMLILLLAAVPHEQPSSHGTAEPLTSFPATNPKLPASGPNSTGVESVPEPGSPPANAPVEAPKGRRVGHHGLEGRIGALLPAQIVDGPNAHFVLGWRSKLTGPLYGHVETGADRATITGLSTAVPSPGGGVALQADEELWAFPALTGLSLGGRVSDELFLGVAVLGGLVYERARLDTKVVEGARLASRTRSRIAPMVRTRLEVDWLLARHALVFGAGWQQILGDADRQMTASGVFLEVGWRADFGD